MTRSIAFNGRETAEYSADNAQASIYGNEPGAVRMFVPNSGELCRWPFFYRPVEGQPRAELKIEERNGLVTVETRSAQSRSEQTIDTASGFLYHSVSEGGAGSGSESWQFGPQTLTGGAILAGLSASFQYSPQRITFRIAALEEADLTPPPARSFAVAAPSGTNVVDFRGNHQNPKRSVTSEPLPDVVARANAIRDDQRSILPVITIGQPSPPLDPTIWLTSSGKCDAPELEGKVVLIDFWGTNCGFCIIELPQVQALHKRLGPQGLVVVGMHDSSGEVEPVGPAATR